MSGSFTRVSTPLGPVMIPAGFHPPVTNPNGGQDAGASVMASNGFSAAVPPSKQFGATFAGVGNTTLTGVPRIQGTESPIDQRKKALQLEMDASMRNRGHDDDYIPGVVYYGRIAIETEALCRLIEEGGRYKKPALSAYNKLRELAFNRVGRQWRDALASYSNSAIRSTRSLDGSDISGRLAMVGRISVRRERGLRACMDVHLMAAFAACSMSLMKGNPHPAEIYWQVMAFRHLAADGLQSTDVYNSDEMAEITAILYAAYVIHAVGQDLFGEYLRYVLVFADETSDSLKDEMRLLTRLADPRYVKIHKDRRRLTTANIALIKVLNERAQHRTKT